MLPHGGLKVRRDLADRGMLGLKRREVDEPAEPLGPFEKDHLVAAAGGNLGHLQAGRTTPRDDYAAALREYNGRRPLQGSVRVEVPPIHVLKKRYPQMAGAAVTPAGRSTDGWGPAGASGGIGPPPPTVRSSCPHPRESPAHSVPSRSAAPSAGPVAKDR